MTLTAKVRNHSIALPPDIDIPEGTEVRVIIEETARPAGSVGSFYESIKHLIGAAKDLPEDFADEHDHYIHGTPKRSAK